MSYIVLIYDYVNIDNGDVIKPWLDQLRPIVKAKESLNKPFIISFASPRVNFTGEK
jgi:hypothetical protein